MRTLLALLAAATLTCAACGGDDDAPATDAGPGSDAGGGSDAAVDGGLAGSSSATLTPECGPADGPALRLRLYGSPTACGEGGTAPIEIFLFDNLPVGAPAVLTIGSDFSADGTAIRCDGPGSCVNAESGTITFETYETDVGGTGTYTLTFGDGDEGGAFDATWCDAGMLMCG